MRQLKLPLEIEKLIDISDPVYHIETCGEERNSYSKTDHDATSMRLKRDYMGNDQLLPAYNLQAAICDESGINCYPSGSAAKS